MKKLDYEGQSNNISFLGNESHGVAGLYYNPAAPHAISVITD
jgi:hypothetical protein